MKQEGFSLIELLVVMAIVAVVGTGGMVVFNDYNKSQLVQTAATDVQTMLNLARSRAQAQVKPASCPSAPNNYALYGYRVVISSPNIYRLYVSCSDTPIANPATDTSGDKLITQQDKTLPVRLNFDGPHSLFFPVLTGGVASVDCIEISGDLVRGVMVNSMGEANVQTSCSP